MHRLRQVFNINKPDWSLYAVFDKDRTNLILIDKIDVQLKAEIKNISELYIDNRKGSDQNVSNEAKQ